MKILKNKVKLDDGREFSVGSEPYDKDGRPQLVRKALDWKHLFDVSKRSRARALCDSGAVGNLKVNDNSIHAYVKDKSSYRNPAVKAHSFRCGDHKQCGHAGSGKDTEENRLHSSCLLCRVKGKGGCTDSAAEAGWL